MKKIFLLCSFIWILCLFGCKSEKEESKPTLVGIEKVGSLVVEIKQYEAYAYEDIKINALYDDVTSIDISQDVTFEPQRIDTEQVGMVTVTVTYQTQTTQFQVNVVPNPLLTADSSKMKVVYQPNDVLSLDGLKVYYQNKEIDQYQCTLYNASLEQFNLKDPISSIGMYELQIKYLNQTTSIGIMVASSPQKEVTIGLDQLLESYPLEQDGHRYLSEGSTLCSQYFISVEAEDARLSKDELLLQRLGVVAIQPCCIYLRANSLSLEILKNEEAYPFAYHASEDGYSISVFLTPGVYTFHAKDLSVTELKLQAFHLGSIESSYDGIRLDTEDVLTYYIMGENISFEHLAIYAYTDLITNRLSIEECRVYILYEKEEIKEITHPGTYQIVIAYDDFSQILTASYDIVFVEPSDVKIKSFEFDLSNVKQEFQLEEEFEYQNLKVYAILENNVKKEFDLSNFLIQLQFENEIVSEFSVEGTYQVIIQYLNILPCENSVCSYSVTYGVKK